jgi:hypothetical protein
MVSVLVENQGKSRSRFLQECLREICFICAVKECELRAIHIDGSGKRLHEPIPKNVFVCILSIWKSKDQIISSVVTKSEKSLLHKNMLKYFFFNHFNKL